MKSFTKKFILRVFFSALFTCLVSFVYAQNVLIVDNNQGAGAQYTSLQTAINAASPGDIIYVQPSPDDYGSININKQISLYGIGYNPELNAGEYARIININFTGTASGSVISGLYIGGIYFGGGISHNVIIMNNLIAVVNGSPATDKANNIIIQGNSFLRSNNELVKPLNSQNWIVTNNTFQFNHTNSVGGFFKNFNNSTIFKNNLIKTNKNGDSNGSIEVFEDCIGAKIYNNIFLFIGTGVSNMNLGNNSAMDFQNNLTYSYNSTLDPMQGSNNLDNMDPLFVSYDPANYLITLSNDFHLQTGSPAIGAGNDGEDLGIYRNQYPFTIRGYPYGLPYLTEFLLYNTTISPGGTLNIHIKANANITN